MKLPGYRQHQKRFKQRFTDRMLIEAIYCLEEPTIRNLAAALNCTKKAIRDRISILVNEGVNIQLQPELGPWRARMYATDWRPPWHPSLTLKQGSSPSPTS